MSRVKLKKPWRKRLKFWERDEELTAKPPTPQHLEYLRGQLPIDFMTIMEAAKYFIREPDEEGHSRSMFMPFGYGMLLTPASVQSILKARWPHIALDDELWDAFNNPTTDEQRKEEEALLGPGERLTTRKEDADEVYSSLMWRAWEFVEAMANIERKQLVEMKRRAKWRGVEEDYFNPL